MVFGKLYTYEGNPRTTPLLAVAKVNGLELDIVNTDPWAAGGVSDDYRRINRLGKVPSFEGSDGYILTECIAIAIYLTSQNERTVLLGKTKQDYASILRWMSFANHELMPSLSEWYKPLVGRVPYNKKAVEDTQKRAALNAKFLDDHFLVNTFLVGERITLADLFVAATSFRGFENFFDKEWRAEHPNFTRWYSTVRAQPIYHDIAGDYKFIDEAIPNHPPKSDKPKAEKPKQEKKQQEKPKAAPKPAKKEVEEEENDEPAPAAPKAKHPLELLPRATFVLDDWKRKYSNEETREVALPWFWENCKFDEYSLYRVDYKYNDELTLTFMSSNLIGGFFARLEASRKFIFGAASVFGVSNDSVVRGAFVVRGQEPLPAFDVAPDYESYEFTKLDPTKAEDKEFVDDMWAWDKPIEVNGKTYEWADGKVFK